MAEAFSGSIAQFKVIDIINLLASEGKTGALYLQRGKEKGEIYFNGGAIIHAICKDGLGEDALFIMLTWSDGIFNFSPNVISDDRTIEKATPKLLEEKKKQLEEWQKIKEIIPTQDIIFRLSSKRAPDEVRLDHDSWSVLSQIDGKKTVGDISYELKMSEYETTKHLYALFLAGLIEVASTSPHKAKKVVDGGFFDLLEKALAEIIGPVAPVIVEDEIRDMGEEKATFPVDKVSLLVEKVSREIANEAQRIAFQKTALNALRR